jgi:biotin operon repressor
MIEQRGDQWFATEHGAASAGDVELPPAPGPDLARWWASRISGTPKIVEALLQAHPHALSREELGERIGMIHTGGSFGEYIRRLRRNGIAIERADGIRLSDEVMGE